MAIPALPAINQDVCGSLWIPQQIDLYNALPEWFYAREVATRRKYGNLSKFFGKMDWQPNKGSQMTGIVIEPPPVKRQFAFPQKVATAAAKKDIIQSRERTYPAALAHHKFESPQFQWVPSFQDFMTNKVKRHLDFVLKWQQDFKSMFERGYMFHQSPAVMFAGSHIDEGAPMGDGNDAGTSGKSDAYLQAQVNSNMTGLSFKELFRGLSFLEDDAMAPPYESGSIENDSFINDKFLLYTSSEVWNQFPSDPWVKEMKDLNLNLVTDGFKGSILGRITAMLASNPLRFTRADDGSITWPEPETIEENPDAENFGQTVRNPLFTATTHEVSFLLGRDGYDVINPGPPPGDFASVGGLSWNGRPKLTDELLIKCEDGETVSWEPNRYGEFLQIISYAMMGIAGVTKRNVLPIIHLRRRTLDTAFV